MPFVVTEPCIQCKFTDCVAACPVDCFRDGPNFLVIDPDECIDCGACVPECPVEAIFDAEAVPEEWTEYIDHNKKLAALWPSIRDATDPLPTADDWRKTEGKDQYLHLDAEAAAALGRSPYGPAPVKPPAAGEAGRSEPAGPEAEAAPDPSQAPAPAPAPTPAPAPAPAPAAAPAPAPAAAPAPARAATPGPAPASASAPSQPGLARKVARKVLPGSLRSSLKKVLGRG